MLKLKLQYFGHLMRRVDSLEKTLMLGGIGGRRRRGWQRMRWLDGITLDGRESEWTPGVGDGQGGLACCNSWGHKESDMTEWLNWTEASWRRQCHTIVTRIIFYGRQQRLKIVVFGFSHKGNGRELSQKVSLLCRQNNLEKIFVIAWGCSGGCERNPALV